MNVIFLFLFLWLHRNRRLQQIISLQLCIVLDWCVIARICELKIHFNRLYQSWNFDQAIISNIKLEALKHTSKKICCRIGIRPHSRTQPMDKTKILVWFSISNGKILVSNFVCSFYKVFFQKSLYHSIIKFLRAATGFEFGDNEASEPKTDDNGVAQISFQVRTLGYFFCWFSSY